MDNANTDGAATMTTTTAFRTTPKESLIGTCTEAQSLAVATQVAVYCLVALGIALNTAVSILMLRNKVVGKNMSNYFIFHLSAVDLVFRVLVTPPLLYMTVEDSSVENVTIACKCYVFVAAMCGCATFVSLVAIAMDVYKESSNTLRGIMSIPAPVLLTLGVWFYAIVSSAPFLYSTTSLVYTDLAEAMGNETLNSGNCTVPMICDLKQGWSGKLTTTLYMVLAVFLPFTIILVLYVKTSFNLEQRDRSKTIERIVAVSKARITRMLMVLGLGALISWGPAAVVSLLRSYKVLHVLDFDVVLVIAKTVQVMQFLNSVMNPFIFACFISNFRRDYFGLCCRQTPDQNVAIQHRIRTLASTELDSKTTLS